MHFWPPCQKSNLNIPVQLVEVSTRFFLLGGSSWNSLQMTIEFIGFTSISENKDGTSQQKAKLKVTFYPITNILVYLYPSLSLFRCPAFLCPPPVASPEVSQCTSGAESFRGGSPGKGIQVPWSPSGGGQAQRHQFGRLCVLNSTKADRLSVYSVIYCNH